MPTPLDTQGLPSGYNFHPDWELTPRQVKAILDLGQEFCFIDCRSDKELALARIDGTEHVPLQDIANRLEDIHKNNHRQIVVHCHHGIRSLRMVQVLREHGFDDVKSMAGGIDLWSIDIDPNVARY